MIRIPQTLCAAAFLVFTVSAASTVSATNGTLISAAPLESVTHSAKRKCKSGFRFSKNLGRCVRIRRGSY